MTEAVAQQARFDWQDYQRWSNEKRWEIIGGEAFNNTEVFVLEGDSYWLHRSYSKDDTLRSPTFRGLAVELRPLFAFPLEPGEEVRMVREGRPKYGK